MAERLDLEIGLAMEMSDRVKAVDEAVQCDKAYLGGVVQVETHIKAPDCSA